MAVKTKLTLSVAMLILIVIVATSATGFVNFKSSSVDNYSNKLHDQAYLVQSQ